MKGSTYNILIGGEAGQGIVTIGDILTKVLSKSGYHVLVCQDYQSRIRGGHNAFSIRFGCVDISATQDTIDLLIALNAETIEIHKHKLNKASLAITDSEVNSNFPGFLSVPYKEIAEKGHINTAALGIASALVRIDEKLVVDTVNSFFEKKLSIEDAKQNAEIVRRAYNWVEDKKVELKIEKPQMLSGNRIIINGNQAIALGAISAGLKFYSFYPMTPSTSIGLEVIRRADEMEIVVEQAEDEISAINMAIGASYAGVPSMVATSGGGFALMVEGVSLAAMTETPIVIAVAGRPGPATGLPTRTEQGDMEFVLHAGHGEFSRAIFAPGTIEECFYLTNRAFHIAERYQTPVFILTDQFLADSTRDVEPFDLKNARTVNIGADIKNITGKYKRFQFTSDGVSPRLLPGMSEHLVIVDSDEHTEDGHLTEDLIVRKMMVEKRLKKLEGILKERTKPIYNGSENPDILFVTWGSAVGPVKEVAKKISENGVKVAIISFLQLWPIEGLDFIDHFKNAKHIVIVEGNATGQLCRLIRRETGFEIKDKILRYDGLPITPEYIFERLKI